LDWTRLPNQHRLLFDFGKRVLPSHAATEIELCLDKFKLGDADLFVYRDAASYALLLLKVDREDASVLALAVDPIADAVLQEIASLVQSRLDAYAVSVLAAAVARDNAVLDRHDAKLLFSQRPADWSLAVPCAGPDARLLEALKTALPTSIGGLSVLALAKGEEPPAAGEIFFHGEYAIR